jgi:hypothetical protein
MVRPEPTTGRELTTIEYDRIRQMTEDKQKSEVESLFCVA